MYVFILNDGTVSWESSKQSIIVDSIIEVEYIAISEVANEAVWMKKFITKLGVVPEVEEPAPLYCDNTGTVIQAKEPRSHQRSRHILRHFYLI